MDNIKYLVGSGAKLNVCLMPFDNSIVRFLDELSKTINKLNVKNFTDVKALSFFCRKKNILKLKSKYVDENSVRFGLGTLFHITPSNIPTNFAYSLVFGLITGNSNIVKVPSKNFEEINLICESINKTLKKKFFLKVKHMIAIIKYEKSDELTKKFSLISNGRLIWGGDQTINEIKKFQTHPKTIDIPFSDRYSISIINSDKFLRLSEIKTSNLITNFYNDTYAVDQNACSSPHIILWYGKTTNNSQKKFWEFLSKVVINKYDPPLISVIDNTSRLVANLMKNKDIKKHKRYNKSLYVLKIKNLKNYTTLKKTKWGFFYECNIKNLNELKYLTNKNLQTITYFGFKKSFLKSFFRKNNFQGIDRVVPFGQGLNINLVWDGYDLAKMLSREIEII